VANDKSETPDFSDLDFSAESLDEGGALDDAGLTPQFDDLGDGMDAAMSDGLDGLQPQAEATDQSEPSDDAVTGDDAEQLDVLEQEEETGSEGEPEEPAEEKEEQESFLTRLGQTSPYTVILGMALVAILIAITCLFMELKLYDFNIKPPADARPGARAAAEIVHPGPPSTTAVA